MMIVIVCLTTTRLTTYPEGSIALPKKKKILNLRVAMIITDNLIMQ